MLDLGKMRDEIDVIDSEIVRLFEKRMKICENVAQFKIETGKPVFDKSREQDKLKTLGAKAGSDFNRCGVEELFQQIMSISRKRQYQLLQENGIEEPSDFTKIDFINKENVTVVLITHYMEEVIHANKVYVMDGGNVVMQGTPREIFSQVETLKKYRLDVPQVTLLAHELHKAGVDIPEGILTKEELVGALCR